MSQYQRWQTPIITNGLKTRRIVIIAGARQCGKTSLTKLLVTKNVTYRSLDNDAWLRIAKTDPHEFIKHQNQLMIIDEVKKAVDLLPAMKMAVDEDTRPGQFLLTGSANLASLPTVTESLAGRIRKIPLRPLAQGEILNHQPDFLGKVFSHHFRELKPQKLSRDEIIEIALRGGYPEPLVFSSYIRSVWHEDYINALLDKDLSEITNIKKRSAMEDLIRIVASWSTKLIDLTAIGSGLSIQRHTLESYLNALAALYLIDHVRPYLKSDYDRIGKKSKLIINDSGLMASLLNWNLENIRFNGDSVGKLIETHVGNELQKHIDHTEHRCKLYYYRDRDHREVDFLIENHNGDLVGIEVKASTSADTPDFKHLKWFKENIAPKDKKFAGIVLHTGDITTSFGNGMWAIPISTLY